MTGMKKILAAVDFSDYSLAVLKQAAELARGFGSELIIVNVINQRDVDAVRMIEPLQPGRISVESYVQTRKEERESRLQVLLHQSGCEDLHRKVDFKVGVPFEQIIIAAREEQADLVIMGPKGQTNLSGVLFGTTAEKVFRHCPVNLLSIRGPAHSRKPG
jgi:nucleotide-binding universal stress UspA family protein